MKDFDYLADVYRRLVPMVQGHLADFSDADMLVRPAADANHAAWQLAHIVGSTTNLANLATPGAIPAIPEAVAKPYGKEGAKMDSGFESKQQMLDRLSTAVQAAVAWVQKLSDEDKAKPLPEKLHGFARTVGELAIMLPVHISMHVGQMQGIRRKLGKPVLF
jgi:hypothetical protein